MLYRRGELCSPVLICYELTGDRRSPLRLYEIFNIVSIVNHHIPTIRRDRACPRPAACDIILNFKITHNLYFKKQLNC